MGEASVQTILARLDALTDEVRALRAERSPPAPAGDLTVEQFAQAIGRRPLYVYRRIASRQIAVRSGGKPYRIPASEAAKFRKTTRTL